MTYPFQPIPHKEYPNTFLENTAVSFISEKWDGKFKDSFTKLYTGFVERFFGLKKEVQQFKEKQKMSVTALENDITFTFTPDKSYLRVGRKKYHTFVSSIIPELLPLKAFVFGVMEMESIENLMIRKLNIFPIQADSIEEVQENTLDIYKFIYKPELLDVVEKIEVPQDAPWILDFRKGKFTNHEDEITIRIGIAQSKSNENTYNVILDSSARCAKPHTIEEGTIDRILLRLNDQLFDSYHWCVSSEIIQLMEKAEEK